MANRVFQLIKSLVDDYEKVGRAKIQKAKRRQLNQAISVVFGFTKLIKGDSLFLKATRYDLFETLSSCIDLHEDRISDFLKSIIDPSSSPWGKEILLSIIEKDPIPENREIADILRGTEPNMFLSKSRPRDTESSVDLRIATRNTERNVIIAFEFKRTGGGETENPQGAQTVRQARDLKSSCTKDEKLVAYYVTPSGCKASSPLFRPLRTFDLLGLIDKELRVPKGKYSKRFTKEAIGAIHHLLRSRWLQKNY